MEQRSLKATVEPMLMSARRQAITDVIKTEYMGTADFSVTFGFTISSIILTSE